jgi:WD40 repeat protein
MSKRPPIADRLRSHVAPDEPGAAERSWRVVEAAHAARTPTPARRRPHVRLAIAVALAAAVLAAVLSPAGASVRDWIGDAIGTGNGESRPTLARLPASGRLLVAGGSGAWVVRRDGSMRRLGDYAEAGWSPRGLFVVAARGRRLSALEPDGTVRWSVVAPARVTHPVWSPGDGFRIAYLAGDSLRVVAGDGTGDRLVRRGAAPVEPAWRPGPGHVLTYVTSGGRVVTEDVDAGRRLWSVAGAPRDIAWTPGGRRLLTLSRERLRLHDPTSRGRGWSLGVAGGRWLAVDPRGRRAAVVSEGARLGSVGIVRLSGPAAGERRLFAGRGGLGAPTWSPDGRRLLVPWPGADQWVMLGRGAPILYGRIASQFDPGPAATVFPRVEGWCCP